MRNEYQDQVKLLLQVLPFLANAESFALKGGTAINFFVRDFPRLSVDIDLTYLPLKTRKVSLQEISQSIHKIAVEIEERIPSARVKKLKSGGTLSKLAIRANGTQIKLEVNTVLRGTIEDPVEMELSPKLQEEFELFTAVKTLSFEDLYGGKLCAALDRQHPRDLFDVRLLLNNEGITEGVRKAFIGYLVSHSRPINELLNPNVIPIDTIYRKEFEGMTDETNILDELKEVQRSLPDLILNRLTDAEKRFLLSFKSGTPNWELVSIPVLIDLPGVQWKLLNISKMDSKKHAFEKNRLEQVLR